MSEAATREKVRELVELLTGLPSPDSTSSITSEGTYIRSAHRKDQSLEDVLDQLRMHLKYLVFDLEATRRENRYLRQMLEARFPPEGPNKSGTDGTINT